jgi:hypothetical protein
MLALLRVKCQKADVRVVVTAILRTNGVLKITAVATNCGPVTVIWGAGDTPFYNARWLLNDGWKLSAIPNGFTSSLGVLEAGESFERSFEAPGSARGIQALAQFQVFNFSDRVRESLIRAGIVSQSGVISELLKQRSQRRDDLDVASDVMTVKE